MLFRSPRPIEEFAASTDPVEAALYEFNQAREAVRGLNRRPEEDVDPEAFMGIGGMIPEPGEGAPDGLVSLYETMKRQLDAITEALTERDGLEIIAA